MRAGSQRRERQRGHLLVVDELQRDRRRHRLAVDAKDHRAAGRRGDDRRQGERAARAGRQRRERERGPGRHHVRRRHRGDQVDKLAAGERLDLDDHDPGAGGRQQALQLHRAGGEAGNPQDRDRLGRLAVEADQVGRHRPLGAGDHGLVEVLGVARVDDRHDGTGRSRTGQGPGRRTHRRGEAGAGRHDQGGRRGALDGGVAPRRRHRRQVQGADGGEARRGRRDRDGLRAAGGERHRGGRQMRHHAPRAAQGQVEGVGHAPGVGHRRLERAARLAAVGGFKLTLTPLAVTVSVPAAVPVTLVSVAETASTVNG